MFAEDVGLIPKASFTDAAEKPARTTPRSSCRWSARCGRRWMSAVSPWCCARPCRASTASCSRQPEVLPLNQTQIALLLEAAKADWTQVEPAIFGTLLERALDPRERHALGAHYTPRAYVDRLVQPTVIEPLRQRLGLRAGRRRAAGQRRQAEGRHQPKSAPSTTSCAACACSIRPAAAATFCTSRWNT